MTHNSCKIADLLKMGILFSSEDCYRKEKQTYEKRQKDKLLFLQLFLNELFPY